MKIIIFGANGMLGRYCCLWFGDRVVKTITRDTLDSGSCTVGQIKSVLEAGCYVINCMGVIPQRSTSNRDMIAANALFPHLLYQACLESDCHLIHISTDCVFSGSRGQYVETDPHDATDVYGTSKSVGESDEYCVIRTSIIGQELFNKRSLLEWVLASEGKQIFGYIDHHWNGVTCLQLAKVIEHSINQGLWTGVRHVFSDETTKYDLLRCIAQIYDVNVIIKPYPTDRVNKTLSSIYETLYVPDLATQIQELRSFDFH